MRGGDRLRRVLWVEKDGKYAKRFIGLPQGMRLRRKSSQASPSKASVHLPCFFLATEHVLSVI